MSKPEFVYVTYIETTPEKLWHALTDGEFTERYWFGTRRSRTGRSARLSRWSNATARSTDAGKVVEYDPPRRLSYTFVNTVEQIPKRMSVARRPSCSNPTASWSS